jgi:hypothetical protein
MSYIPYERATNRSYFYLWGNALSAEDVNAEDFGVAIGATSTVTSKAFYLPAQFITHSCTYPPDIRVITAPPN